MNIINSEDFQWFKKAVVKYTKKACKTKKSARKALQKSGIYSKKDKLTKNYRQQNE